MSHWQPYPEYKPSGVEWLGEIPAHWTTAKLKRGYEVRLGKMLTPDPTSPTDTLELYLRSANVYWEGIDLSDVKEMWFSLWEKEQYKLAPGDLIVCEGGDVGRSAIWAGELADCYIQNAVHRVRSRDGYSNKFLYYWLFVLKSAGYIDLICSKATISHLTAEKLVEIPIVTPSPVEQDDIVAFLNRETTQIDALAAKQERLIALLQEKRAALISHTVTKGLDPAAPMKDSGVPWLGEVPAHWQVIPLKFAARRKPDAIKTGPFGSQLLSSEMMAGEIKVYNQRNVIDRDLTQGDNYISQEKHKELRAFTVYPGDVLVTTRGTIGRCVIVPESAETGILHPCLMRIQPDVQRLLAEFLVLLIQDSTLVQAQLFEMSNATTIDVVYSSTMRQVSIPLPPINEQRAIIAHLSGETAELDALIAKARQVIERLQEYRTALISAAVTGRIDVRGEA